MTTPTETPASVATPTDAAENRSAVLLAVAASPQDPVVAQATCVRGVVTPPKVTFATTPGITYQAPSQPVAGETYILVGNLASGYTWGPLAEGWSFVGNEIAAIYSVELNEVPPCADVVPTSPTVRQATCSGGTFAAPSVTLPANTDVIGYTRVGQPTVGRSVVVTAELLRDADTWASPLPAGWIADGSFAVFSTGVFAKATCAPAAPVITAAACRNGVANPTIVTAPADTNALQYQVIGGQGYAIVIARFKISSATWVNPMPDGWRASDETLALSSTIEIETGSCTATNLVSPQVFHTMIVDSYEPGDVLDLTPIVPASPGITYRISGTVGPDGEITVIADLREGYDWPDDLPSGWRAIDDDTAILSFTIDANLDVFVSPDTPTVTQATCANGNAVVTLPDTVGVTYAKAGDHAAGGIVTVSAALDAGYAWAESMPSGWALEGGTDASYAIELDDLNCGSGVVPEDPGMTASSDPGTTLVTGLPSTGAGASEGTTIAWVILAMVACVGAGFTLRKANGH